MARGQGIYREGYFKVSRRILESSLWCEDGDVVKLFLALVAMSQDPGGPRNGSVFIARRQLAAKVFLSDSRLDECLAVLAGQDAESRTQDHGGRRIEVLPNGFRVLNYGLYHDEAKDRLLSETRAEAGRIGGLRSGKSRSRKGNHPSKPEASLKQNEATETETETRRRLDGNGLNGLPPSAACEANKAWTSKAIDIWEDKFAKGSGSSIAGRMGRVLKPLVSAHGWEKVGPALTKYVSETTHPSPSPEDFAKCFGKWCQTTPTFKYPELD